MTKSSKTLEDHASSHSKKCQICNDIARGLNYNVITCMSCKSFFYRNAHKQSLLLCCQFENNCNIIKETRSYCSPCRLKKCLALGMDPRLIGSSARSYIIPNKTRQLSITQCKQIQLPTPSPLGLLQNDRSILTTSEWTLLSNFIHIYDKQDSSRKIQNCLNQLSSLPPKLRLKSTDTYNMIGQFFTDIQSLIECSPDLSSIPVDARRALTKYNLDSTGSLNGIFVCREYDLFNNSIFLNACNMTYGVEFVKNCIRSVARCDPNGILIKIILFVMTFSSNCSIVIFDDQEHITTISSSLDLIRVQDVYVTMLWKYLIYLYGFREATLRFSSLVKSIIDVIHMLELMPENKTHKLMVETIVSETEHALRIED